MMMRESPHGKIEDSNNVSWPRAHLHEAACRNWRDDGNGFRGSVGRLTGREERSATQSERGTELDGIDT